MKDERTLAEALEIVTEWLAIAKETPRPLHSSLNYVPIAPSELEAIEDLSAQALRSQPTVEDVARVSEDDIAVLKRVIGIEYYAGSDEFGDALKRILAALYKGEGG